MNAVRSIATAQVAVLPQLEENRLARRRLVNVAAMLEDAGASFSDIQITDISETGCRASSTSAVETGSALMLKLPGMGLVRAQVVWADGSGFGCTFEDALHMGAIDQMLGRGSEAQRPAIKRRGVFGTKGAG
jgi:hypothetical protein